MKITCNELRAVSGQSEVNATLSDVQKIQAETPDEIKVIVETVGWAQLLEEIGMEKVLKHFGIRPLNIKIRNQLNNGLSIDFCIGEKEVVLKREEEVTVELTEDVNMYLDVVK